MEATPKASYAASNLMFLIKRNMHYRVLFVRTGQEIHCLVIAKGFGKLAYLGKALPTGVVHPYLWKTYRITRPLQKNHPVSHEQLNTILSTVKKDMPESFVIRTADVKSWAVYQHGLGATLLLTLKNGEREAFMVLNVTKSFPFFQEQIGKVFEGIPTEQANVTLPIWKSPETVLGKISGFSNTNAWPSSFSIGLKQDVTTKLAINAALLIAVGMVVGSMVLLLYLAK